MSIDVLTPAVHGATSNGPRFFTSTFLNSHCLICAAEWGVKRNSRLQIQQNSHPRWGLVCSKWNGSWHLFVIYNPEMKTSNWYENDLRARESEVPHWEDFATSRRGRGIDVSTQVSEYCANLEVGPTINGATNGQPRRKLFVIARWVSSTSQASPNSNWTCTLWKMLCIAPQWAPFPLRKWRHGSNPDGQQWNAHLYTHLYHNFNKRWWTCFAFSNILLVFTVLVVGNDSRAPRSLPSTLWTHNKEWSMEGTLHPLDVKLWVHHSTFLRGEPQKEAGDTNPPFMCVNKLINSLTIQIRYVNWFPNTWASHVIRIITAPRWVDSEYKFHVTHLMRCVQ